MLKIKPTIKYQPPICPSCGYKLKKVWENDYQTYIFNPKTGTYICEEFAGDIEIKCPECEADLTDIFEEGACNYQAKKNGKN